MQLLTLKLLAAAGLGLLSILSLAFPVVLSAVVSVGRRESVTSYVNCFGGGVFISAALVGLLAEAAEGSEDATVVFISASIGFLIPIMLEHVALPVYETLRDRRHTTAVSAAPARPPLILTLILLRHLLSSYPHLPTPFPSSSSST